MLKSNLTFCWHKWSLLELFSYIEISCHWTKLSSMVWTDISLCTRCALNGGQRVWMRGGFPPSFLCRFLFNIPGAPQRWRLFIHPPTEGALAAGLVSVAVEQCVMQLATGGGGVLVEWRRTTACVTPHMLPLLDGQISQPIPTFSPGGRSLNTPSGSEASLRSFVMWCQCGSCWGTTD